MKTLIRLLLIVCAIAISGGQTYAQGDKHRVSREQLAETQAKHIAEKIDMDKATSERFISTYCQFQKEIWALGPRPGKQHRKMSDEETGQAIKDRFAHSQKILDIREKYYGIYSEFLTQSQIQRVYDLERQMMKRLSRHDKAKAPTRRKR